MIIDIPDDWLPTAENVNALPAPLRRYIHDLSTNCDPAGNVQTIKVLRENVAALTARIDELHVLVVEG